MILHPATILLPRRLAILIRIPMALLLHTRVMDLHMTTVVKLPLIQNKLWVESVPLQMMTLTMRPLIPLSHRILALDRELTRHVTTVAAMDTIILTQPTSRPSLLPRRR